MTADIKMRNVYSLSVITDTATDELLLMTEKVLVNLNSLGVKLHTLLPEHQLGKAALKLLLLWQLILRADNHWYCLARRSSTVQAGRQHLSRTWFSRRWIICWKSACFIIYSWIFLFCSNVSVNCLKGFLCNTDVHYARWMH